MKIQNLPPLPAGGAKKKTQATGGNAFQSLLDNELATTATDAAIPVNPRAVSNDTDAGEGGRQAWQSLQQGLELLDEAMEQLASGNRPAAETMERIDALRRDIQQANSTLNSSELNAANTILAVEAARMRDIERDS